MGVLTKPPWRTLFLCTYSILISLAIGMCWNLGACFWRRYLLDTEILLLSTVNSLTLSVYSSIPRFRSEAGKWSRIDAGHREPPMITSNLVCNP